MKKLIFGILMLCGMMNSNASAAMLVDDFNANSFGWTECAFESNNGSAVIDKGCLTVKSKGVNKFMSGLMTGLSGVKTQIGENTFFETHCYAPIDVTKDFVITSNVTIDKLAQDRIVGFVFNYRDGGTFYSFLFNEEMVMFSRYVDNAMVGKIVQGVKWPKNSKLDQVWKLEKIADELAFSVDGMEILRVRYMPLEYAGVGFYTYGKQTLLVNEMSYQQD